MGISIGPHAPAARARSAPCRAGCRGRLRAGFPPDSPPRLCSLPAAVRPDFFYDSALIFLLQVRVPGQPGAVPGLLRGAPAQHCLPDALPVCRRAERAAMSTPGGVPPFIGAYLQPAQRPSLPARASPPCSTRRRCARSSPMQALRVEQLVGPAELQALPPSELPHL